MTLEAYIMNPNNRLSNPGSYSFRLLLCACCLLAIASGCNGGGDSSSAPYGSTLTVRYYSDPECKRELGTAGSRFSIPSSGETSCKTHPLFKNVALSLEAGSVDCEEGNPTSCSVQSGAAVGYKVECDENCVTCASASPADGTYHVGDCIPFSTNTLKDSADSYMMVSTAATTGAFYLGASEKTGSAIKMYDPNTLDSFYLDTSGSKLNDYSRSLAVSESDIAKGYTNVLYSALDNGILWQCSSDASNACGTWNTAPTIPFTIISNGQGIMFVGLENGEIWQCPTNSANSCTTFSKLSDSVFSLAYDSSSNTLYAGTSCGNCSSAGIYQFPGLNPSPILLRSVSGSFNQCNIGIQDLEFGGGQLWATSAASCDTYTVDPSTGDAIYTYSYSGELITCRSGSCQAVGSGDPYWSLAYDSDHNLIFAGQVGHSDTASAAGVIVKVDASSLDAPTTFTSLGSLSGGFDRDTMQSPLPPQALLYAAEYLWIGTGNTSCASCNSLFRCPVTADNSDPSCAQVNLNCHSVDNCMGAQSMTYIASVNYP